MELLSVPTILICTFMAMSAASITMGIVWFYNRQEHSAGYWALGFFLGALSGISVVFRHIFPDLESGFIVLESILLITAYMLVFNGFRAFNRQKVYHLASLAVPLLWLLAYALWPTLRTDPNTAIALLFAITATISLVSAFTVFTGSGNRNLPMAVPVAVFLTTHGLFHFSQVGFAIFDPSPIVNGHVVAGWWKGLLLESFLHTVLTGISCVILIKDRSEEKHRLASETDPLTGIANRRAFVNRIGTALGAIRENAVMAIIDIDHFKQINDQHGHQAGDQALISFARLIESSIPAQAQFGRIGGEEFGLFLPEEIAQPLELIETVRHMIETSPVAFNGIEIRMTVSIGVATIESAGKCFDTLSAAADSALYIAKKSGRNRVVCFSPAQRLNQLVQRETAGVSRHVESPENENAVGEQARYA